MYLHQEGLLCPSIHPASFGGGPRLNPRPSSFQHISDLWKMLLGSPRHLNPANSPPPPENHFLVIIRASCT